MDDISDPRAATAWPTRARPHQRVKIYMGDDMVGVGKLRLLALVDEHGDLAAAAAAMGVGMERAGFLLETLQRCFSAPLLTTGEGARGAAAVTPFGRELIRRYDAHVAALDAASAEFLGWLEANQRPPEAKD